MAGSESRASIPVEVLVEKQQIAPVRVGLEFLHIAMRRPPALVVPQENSGQPPGQFRGHLPERERAART